MVKLLCGVIERNLVPLKTWKCTKIDDEDSSCSQHGFCRMVGCRSAYE